MFGKTYLLTGGPCAGRKQRQDPFLWNCSKSFVHANLKGKVRIAIFNLALQLKEGNCRTCPLIMAVRSLAWGQLKAKGVVFGVLAWTVILFNKGEYSNWGYGVLAECTPTHASNALSMHCSLIRCHLTQHQQPSRAGSRFARSSTVSLASPRQRRWEPRIFLAHSGSRTRRRLGGLPLQ